MNSQERLSQRFNDMGRFFCQNICALPGILENISRDGCKICYQLPVSVDMDSDYESKITFARAAGAQFSLVCHPQWIKECGSTTEIGFRILPSTDYARLAAYIQQLEEDNSEDMLEFQPSESVCQIIK